MEPAASDAAVAKPKQARFDGGARPCPPSNKGPRRASSRETVGTHVARRALQAAYHMRKRQSFSNLKTACSRVNTQRLAILSGTVVDNAQNRVATFSQFVNLYVWAETPMSLADSEAENTELHPFVYQLIAIPESKKLWAQEADNSARLNSRSRTSDQVHPGVHFHALDRGDLVEWMARRAQALAAGEEEESAEAMLRKKVTMAGRELRAVDSAPDLARGPPTTWREVILEGRGVQGESVLHLCFLLMSEDFHPLNVYRMTIIYLLTPKARASAAADVTAEAPIWAAEPSRASMPREPSRATGCATWGGGATQESEPDSGPFTDDEIATLVNKPYDGHKYHGETCLHFAAVQGDTELVSLLLQRGAKADGIALADGAFFYQSIHMYFGGTVLGFAACRGHRMVVELLLDALEREGTSLDLNRVDMGPHILPSATVEWPQHGQSEEGNAAGGGSAGGGAGRGAGSMDGADGSGTGGGGCRRSSGGKAGSWGSESGAQGGGWRSAEERALELARTYHGLGQIGRSSRLNTSLGVAHQTLDLISSKLNFNVLGNTVLHCLVVHNQHDLYKLLVERRADPLVRNQWGQTPLAMAAAQGSKPMFEVALEAITLQRWQFGGVPCLKYPLHEIDSLLEADSQARYTRYTGAVTPVTLVS